MDIQKLSGHGPGQLVVGGHALEAGGGLSEVPLKLNCSVYLYPHLFAYMFFRSLLL